MATPEYATNVFINCPFDAAYKPIFEGIIFAVHDCGFVARCALEEEDSGAVRVVKLYDLIADCRLGIHDISRVEVSRRSRLPRFNMPLELGVFLGAARYGGGKQRQKRCLVLDREAYRYQASTSDIAGQDIRAHGNDPDQAIIAVRNWLSQFVVPAGTLLPGGKKMTTRHAKFRAELPAILRTLGITRKELIYNDYSTIVSKWLESNP